MNKEKEAPQGYIFATYIPVIRKMMPALIASEISNVQPIDESVFNSLMNVAIQTESRCYNFGDLIHSFGRGWLVFDGKDFIPERKFISWYGHEKVRAWNNYYKLRGIQ
jgi:hypothetical protein